MICGVSFIKVKNFITLFGLICNFIGTLFLVFYISFDEKKWVKKEDRQKPGEKWFAILVKHPKLLNKNHSILVIKSG